MRLAQAPTYQLCATQERESGKLGSRLDHAAARDPGYTLHVQKLYRGADFCCFSSQQPSPHLYSTAYRPFSHTLQQVLAGSWLPTINIGSDEVTRLAAYILDTSHCPLYNPLGLTFILWTSSSHRKHFISVSSIHEGISSFEAANEATNPPNIDVILLVEV